MSTGQLAIWIASREGLAIAQKLARLLAVSPWRMAEELLGSSVLFVPERLALPGTRACLSLASTFRQNFFAYRAHVVFGAAGLAVRFLAPVLGHKKSDPCVVVIDSAARFVISLLSGHWGGGNSLAKHLAELLSAIPVITTASDQNPEHFVLDLAVQKRGLCLLDWEELPGIQGRLLEGQSVALYDPFGMLPEAKGLRRSEGKAFAENFPQITVHWQHFPRQSGRLRIAIPHFVVGVGFRRATEPELLAQAFTAFCDHCGFPREAVMALATIDDKAGESCLCELAKFLQLPVDHYGAELLALELSPNPSVMAGKVFHQQPFSVCEAAAQISARKRHQASVLFFPKASFFGKITFAAAGSAAFLLNKPTL